MGNAIPPQSEPPAPSSRNSIISLVLALVGAACFFASLMIDTPEVLSILRVVAFLLLLVALIYGGRGLFKLDGRLHWALELLAIVFELLLIGAVVIFSLDILLQALMWIIGAAATAAAAAVLIYLFGAFFG